MFLIAFSAFFFMLVIVGLFDIIALPISAAPLPIAMAIPTPVITFLVLALFKFFSSFSFLCLATEIVFEIDLLKCKENIEKEGVKML